jgi:hypothetical protein
MKKRNKKKKKKKKATIPRFILSRQELNSFGEAGAAMRFGSSYKPNVSYTVGRQILLKFHTVQQSLRFNIHIFKISIVQNYKKLIVTTLILSFVLFKNCLLNHYTVLQGRRRVQSRSRNKKIFRTRRRINVCGSATLKKQKIRENKRRKKK